MKTRITLLLISLIIGIIDIPVLGQEIKTKLKYEDLLPNFNKLTPEAASLGKYGTTEISEYSGEPEIEIPLFDIKSGNLKVPVSLYYDASGVKVEQEATFVGLGWNLNYGGCITHIICGRNDYGRSPFMRAERYYAIMDSLFRDRNFRMKSPVITLEPTLKPLTKEITINLLWTRLTDGLGNYGAGYNYAKESDKELRALLDEIACGYFVPDIFQATFCGHKVSFIIDQETGESVILGDDATRYEIEHKHNGRRYPNEFTITDSEGITYQFKAFCEFGDREDSYFLVNVSDIDGKELLRYNYEQPNTMINELSFYQSIGKQCNSGDFINIGTEMADELFIKERSSWTDMDSYAEKKVYPKSIETPWETVEFRRKERQDLKNGYLIDSIIVTSKNRSVKTHQIALKYDYFRLLKRGGQSTDVLLGVGNVADKRLKLTGVNMDGKEYAFGYDESKSLPYHTSLSQDFWGYYNGVDNGTHFCASPKYKVNGDFLEEVVNLSTANRYCSPDFCKVGVLNRIDYPTGGYSLFDYEVNHFKDPEGFYYMEASDLRQIGPERTMLGHAEVVAPQPAERNVYSNEFTLESDSKVEVQFGLRRESSGASVYASLVGQGEYLYFYIESGKDRLEGDTILYLKAGKYMLRAEAPANNNRLYNTHAVITVNRLTPPRVPKGKEESVGGGLRIKSIKKYSGGENNHFLGGTEYEYEGGKLLIPTVRTRYYERDCVVAGYSRLTGQWDIANKTFRFYHLGSHSFYPPVANLCSPTVGYSTVIKHDIEKDGTKGRKTVSQFHNERYELFEPYNVFEIWGYGRNGKPRQMTVISNEGDTLCDVRCEYAAKAEKKVVFPQCQLMYLWCEYLEELRIRLSANVKSNVWHYLSRTVETQYEGGKPMKPIVTDYTYNNDNYQTSKSTRRQGTQVIEDLYQYPVDGVSAGSDLLIEKHVLSRLTGTKQYLNGKLKGGAQLDFKLHDSIPVVEMYRNILPSGKMDAVLTVVDYDERGNIREYVSRNGTHTTILWSYNYQYPVMQIVGATYEDVKRAYHAISVIGKQKTISLSMMKTLHNMFSAIKEGELQVTAYVYDPWYGVSDIIQPNGKVMHYDKDGQGRLSKILEDSATGPVVQRFFYHYRNR